MPSTKELIFTVIRELYAAAFSGSAITEPLCRLPCNSVRGKKTF